jgi:diguanylate cyclase (GGDEF)-like protein
MWLWLVVLPATVALAAVAVGLVVHAPVVTWDVAWTAGALSAAAAMLAARRRAPGMHCFRWTMWTAAAVCWLGGQLAWNFYGAHVPASPNVGDLGWWGFALCTIVGVMRSPSRSLRKVALVETLMLMAAALAMTCAVLWHDAVHSALPITSRVAVLAYPALYVAAAIATLQALLGGGLRGESSIAARLILGGTAIQALTFTLWSEQLLDQSYVQGASLLDPSFLLGLLLMAAGGVRAALMPHREIAAERHSALGGIVPGAVFALLCAVLFDMQLHHTPLAPRLALGLGEVLSGGALMLRGHLLSRRLQALLERERGAVADLAERESELARLNRRLMEDSRHDPLTGMRNRRALAYDLPRLESAHRERADAFAIVVVDIDHFKSYNDRLGHLAGDHALRTVSGLIRGELREGDIGYRFGGEELLLVLPSTSPRDAVRAAERVRLAVAGAALPHPADIGGILTVSVGVAAGLEDAAALLAQADAALYEAKRSGRNRTVQASGTEAGPGLRQRSSDQEESVPRQLRGMLALSRAAASGLGVMPVLQALAETLRLEMSFEVVAVNLRDRDRDEMEVVVVLGDEEARAALIGATNAWHDVEVLIRPEHERCGAVWLPAGTDLGDLEVWDPVLEADDDPQAWNSQDMLLLPVRGADGEILAVVSVDRPMSGRRPEDRDLSVLMAVADHAGLALERALRDRDVAALREQSAELQLAAVMLLAETLDLRDPGTGRHARTVGIYARHTATALGLPPDRVERIYAAGVLHDLGKLGIADAILYKPGPLDDHEWREIKRHPEVGARILEHAGLTDIAAWVRSHHERVDGLGYPDGLADAEIPLEAKILAVSDAYEAMIADRPYRRGMSPEEARDELRNCAGSQFDPDVVEALLSTLSQEAEAELVELQAAA